MNSLSPFLVVAMAKEVSGSISGSSVPIHLPFASVCVVDTLFHISLNACISYLIDYSLVRLKIKKNCTCFGLLGSKLFPGITKQFVVLPILYNLN